LVGFNRATIARGGTGQTALSPGTLAFELPDEIKWRTRQGRLRFERSGRHTALAQRGAAQIRLPASSSGAMPSRRAQASSCRCAPRVSQAIVGTGLGIIHLPKTSEAGRTLLGTAPEISTRLDEIGKVRVNLARAIVPA
jgi:hypothetical protein